MNKRPDVLTSMNAADSFEVPALVVIGDGNTVVRGFFGTGWDGPYGMTEPLFEFEPDDADD